MKYYFLINEKLPSLNEVIAANRTNKHIGARHKKQIEELIGWYILKAVSVGSLKPIDTACVIRITWHEKTKRRDVDNIQSAQKFILDALQKQGILKNDSRKYVKQIYHEVKDDIKDGVIVEIIEVDDESRGDQGESE